MSEEEIIANAQNFISISVLYGNRLMLLEGQLKRYQETVQGLLDLYKQEKQENKRLENKYKRLQNTEAFQDCYISKDKIKELQGKLCMTLGSYVRNESTPEQERVAGAINILNKLLEEK